ncbi:MAG: hypothetical protein HZA66_02315 [Rhodopseudomonas palustris]|uniref:Uncharacterized protein n=1 Tax=Rhodopseudomonas palustris TaxID=1076 RepID=A0A933VT31_RHOPL|nr:hypothetical protein [Rhodopseudomonas palustris]
MAISDDCFQALRHDHDQVVDAEEELRVLTALIGCIMVAEDAGRSHGRGTLPHLTPPSALHGLAKAG